MKKVLIVLAALCLMMTAVLGVNAWEVEYGDLTGDAEINNRDLVMLQQYLNGWDVAVGEWAADVNGDDEVNNRDLVLLQQYLNGWDVTLGPDESVDPDDSIFNDTELQWP